MMHNYCGKEEMQAWAKWGGEVETARLDGFGPLLALPRSGKAATHRVSQAKDQAMVEVKAEEGLAPLQWDELRSG